jgi:putative transposase
VVFETGLIVGTVHNPLPVKLNYRFRFYPNARQVRALEQLFGCVRWAFNRTLEARRDIYRQSGKGFSYGKTSALLTTWKKEHPFLTKVSCVPLQQSLRQLQRAYANFFEHRTRYPRFRSKRGRQTAEFTRSAFSWDDRNQNLALAKIGRLRIHWSKVIQSPPSTVTITKDCAGRYFVTLTAEESCLPLPENTAQVGIDLGLKTLAMLSTGERIEPLKSLARALPKLRHAQRILSRRQKGSGRRNQQRLRVARLHAQVADIRKDYLDKVTTDLVRRFGSIAIEDLNVAGMITNRKLARAISDAGWGECRRMLEYKCAWYGRELRVANRWEPTSKRCSNCGAINRALELSDRFWTCPSCGITHDRDVNGAKNTLTAGHAVTARGGGVRRSTALPVGRSLRRSVNQPALRAL